MTIKYHGEYPALLLKVAGKMRRKRMVFLYALLKHLPPPLKILDVGGTETFWEMIGLAGDNRYQITMINLETFTCHYGNLQSVQGDARSMTMFQNQSFDLVFSNSVIEHLGTYDAQRLMSQEIRRIGRRYFVQTPNRDFWIEPHFVFPFFQFLPNRWRSWFVQHFKLGWVGRIKNPQDAMEMVVSIRLLSRKEFLDLFPEAKVYQEKILGWTKSFIAYGGFEGI